MSMLIEVVVYTKQDYSENTSVYVSSDLTSEEITEQVNKELGRKGWFYYDIMN